MNEEDCQIDEDNTNEVLAQLMYENRRLKNELDFLNRNMLGYEENIDSLSSNLQEKEEVLRSAERKITSLSQAVEDKHDVNNHLEQELMQLRESNENLENMVRSQKSKERDLSEQIEVLLLSMKDLTEKHNKAEEENSELKIAIQSQSEDVITHASFISDLRCQVKLLEEEKVFLQEKLEFLINERHSNKKLSPSSLLLIHSNNSSPVQRRLDFSPKSDGSSVKNDCSVLSLKEEFLMVEVHEKDRRINQLEEKLCNTEKKLRELRGNAIKYFDEVLPLLDSNKDFQIVSPVIKVTFDKIIAELRGWADGQSGESNPLTEAPDSVKVKEAVINAQPVPNRIVESISIATQTDRLLLAKALEEFSPLQNVLDHKYGDVDMDLYRMSSQNNPEDLNKSDQDRGMSTGNVNEENIHAEPMNPEKDTLNHMNEEEENVPAAETGCVDNLNQDLYNISATIDGDGNCTMSEEEVKKKFDELSLAVRTDAMMLQKRLIRRKRFRDQAEFNVEKEINHMKAKLSSLLCLRFDAEFLEQLSELKKHLDIIFASVTHLSGCAEAYGCVQTEKNLSAAVAIIAKHVEYIERIEAEITKSPEREKSETKSRIQLLPIMDDVQEEKILRRSSVAALAMNGPTKRRASIASVMRNSHPSDDSNGNLDSWNSSVVSSSTNVIRKRVSSSSISSKSVSPLAGGDQPVRSRKESRIDDRFGMKYVQDYGNGHSVGSENDVYLLSSGNETPVKGRNETQRAALRMSGSFDSDSRLSTNSVASETLNIIDSLRSAVKWTLKNSRFQFPENIHQYVPFFITWFVMILIVTTFLGGFFAGFNQCSISQLSQTSMKTSAFFPSAMLLVNLVVKHKSLRYMVITSTVVYVHYLYHIAHEHGVDDLLRILGIKIRSHFPAGAPV